jgi:cytochrome c
VRARRTEAVPRPIAWGAAVLFITVLQGPALAAPRGDAQSGAALYDRCIACHSLERNRTGPKHCGLFDRAAGEAEGYRYSKALRDWGERWTAESLDIFLENPRKVVPGTRMTYAGVKDAQERADLIAYLMRENAPGGICAQ